MFREAITMAIGISLVALSGAKAPSKPPVLPLLAPPESIKRFALGYNESMADVLWIRTIQDFDICNARGEVVVPVGQNTFLEPTEAPSPNEERKPRCRLGWVYRMLIGTTELAPKFRAPYIHGGIVLSVLIDDIKGASEIFRRGLVQYPKDWSLKYRAAYHFAFEEKDYEYAAKLLIEAGNEGAPAWVFRLASSLLTKDGRLDLARNVLKEQIENAKDESHREMFASKLREIERDTGAKPGSP